MTANLTKSPNFMLIYVYLFVIQPCILWFLCN